MWEFKRGDCSLRSKNAQNHQIFTLFRGAFCCVYVFIRNHLNTLRGSLKLHLSHNF